MFARSQLRPVRWLRKHRRIQPRLRDFTVRQSRIAIAGIGKTGNIGNLANLQRSLELCRDPKALGSVLQGDGRAWLVVGNRSPDPHAPGVVAHIKAAQNLVHRRDGKGFDPGLCGPDDLYVRERRNLQHDAGQLHLAVEFSRDRSGDLHVSVEKVFEFALIAAQDSRIDIPALHPQIEIDVGFVLVLDNIRAPHPAMYLHPYAIQLDANQLREGRR